MTSHNYLMLETAPARELAVAQAVDQLVGVDSSYCPLYYEVHRIARHQRTRGKATRANPVIPRYVFITSSFPDLMAVLEIEGALRFGLNNHLTPEVIPGWEMDLFRQAVEAVRLRALRDMDKLRKPSKPFVARSFAELAAAMKRRGEMVDPETGEITEIAA